MSVDGVSWAGFSWSPSGSMIAVADYLGRILVVRSDTLSTLARLEYEYGSRYGLMSGRIDPGRWSWSRDGSRMGRWRPRRLCASVARGPADGCCGGVPLYACPDPLGLRTGSAEG